MNITFKKQSIASLLALLSTSGAFAQEVSSPINSSSEDELSLKEILDVKVSVASLFEERDLDVGASVFAIDHDTWKKQGARRTFEAIRTAPGTMVYENNIFQAGPTVATRGFNDPGQIPSISVLLDGVNMSSIYQQSAIQARPNIDLGVLDRIEMIIGPGSTLYGSDALQGVISLRTPGVEKENLSASVRGGYFGNYQSEVKFAKELAPKLHFSFNGALSGQDSQNTGAKYTPMDIQPGVQAGMEAGGAPPYPYFVLGQSGSASSTLTENFVSSAIVSKLKYEQTEASFYWTLYNAKGFPGPGISARQTGVQTYTPNTAIGDTARLDSSLFMGKLTQDFNLPNSVDLQAMGYYWGGNNSAAYGASAGDVVLTNATAQTIGDMRTGISLIAKRQSDANFPVRIAAGYSLDYTKINSAVETLPGLAARSFAIEGKGRSINAIFVETDTAIIGRTLHLLADAREDVYSDFGGHLSPRLGLMLQPTDNSAVKALYGHAFRAPSALELLGNGGIAGNGNLSPDTLDTFQLQYMQRAKHWKYDITAYTSTWTNQVTIDPLTITYKNATGTPRAYGLELGGQYDLLANLRLNGTGSYVRSFGNPAEGGGTAPYTVFPTYILNWGLDYEIPSARVSISLMNRHQINQGRYIQAAIPAPGLGSVTTPGRITPATMADFFRTDLGATWDFGKNAGDYQLTLNIINLLNRDLYQPAIISNFNGQIPQTGINDTIGLRARI
ncbi:MAG: TonB-dependent receptor [Bdellovibrionia bacterium]